MAVMLFPPGMNQSPVIGRHDIRLMKSTNKSPVVVIFDHGNIGDITFNPPTGIYAETSYENAEITL